MDGPGTALWGNAIHSGTCCVIRSQHPLHTGDKVLWFMPWFILHVNTGKHYTHMDGIKDNIKSSVLEQLKPSR